MRSGQIAARETTDAFPEPGAIRRLEWINHLRDTRRLHKDGLRGKAKKLIRPNSTEVSPDGVIYKVVHFLLISQPKTVPCLMAPTALSYDLFLSYNSADHKFVEYVAPKLRDEGLEAFLDRWALAPGMRWSKLEKTLSTCRSVGISVGQGELGSWQQREVDVALDLQNTRPLYLARAGSGNFTIKRPLR